MEYHLKISSHNKKYLDTSDLLFKTWSFCLAWFNLTRSGFSSLHFLSYSLADNNLSLLGFAILVQGEKSPVVLSWCWDRKTNTGCGTASSRSRYSWPWRSQCWVCCPGPGLCYLVIPEENLNKRILGWGFNKTDMKIQIYCPVFSCKQQLKNSPTMTRSDHMELRYRNMLRPPIWIAEIEYYKQKVLRLGTQIWIAEIECHQKKSSHPQNWPQGADRQLS